MRALWMENGGLSGSDLPYQFEVLLDALEALALARTLHEAGLTREERESWSTLLAGEGLQVYGIDQSPSGLRLATQNLATVGHPGRFVRADAFQLPFADDQFDLVFSTGLLEHFSDPVTLMREMIRTLRPGGLFFYGVYGGRRHEGVFPDDHHQPQRYFVFYPDDELRRRVAGLFDEVSFRTIPVEGDKQAHFQELILRPKERA